jgi:hypothetical protein
MLVMRLRWLTLVLVIVDCLVCNVRDQLIRVRRVWMLLLVNWRHWHLWVRWSWLELRLLLWMMCYVCWKDKGRDWRRVLRILRCLEVTRLVIMFRDCRKSLLNRSNPLWLSCWRVLLLWLFREEWSTRSILLIRSLMLSGSDHTYHLLSYHFILLYFIYFIYFSYLYIYIWCVYIGLSFLAL